MRNCSIKDCKSYELPQRISKHRLFRGGQFDKDWIEAIRTLNGQPMDIATLPKSFSVCSMHFEQKFQIRLGTKNKLTYDAIPTRFPNGWKQSDDGVKENNSTHLISKQTKMKKDTNSEVTQIDQKPPTIYCGVSRCRTNNNNENNISLFEIPKYIRNSPSLLDQWSKVLRFETYFPNNFKICSLHFEKNQILTPLKQGNKEVHPLLRPNAVPCLNLPKPTNNNKPHPKENDCVDKSKYLDNFVNFLSERSDYSDVEEEVIDEDQESDVYDSDSNTKSTQVSLNSFRGFGSYFDTDEKLNTLTGLNNKSLLDALANEALKLIINDDNLEMTMKDRILLTLCRLKTNLDFEQLAILFQIEKKTSQMYFAETIKLLAITLQQFIYWPSKDEHMKNLPECFEYFPNVRTVLECIEIRTHSECKLFVGFAPSGLINYLSTAFNGFYYIKEMFIKTDLLKILEPNDALITDYDFQLQDVLFKVEIEILTPQTHHRKNEIIAAKAHIEKQMEKLKQFKILSGTVDRSLVPLIDDIMTVLCGLTNILFDKRTK
ncbi:uncharacterized protein LOC129913073 [Episyrphus balteatus]|uniref:uncharacterized protein LOC129913073 n=1 Tax=Episyrphus balteatus TaxID=286459 RepID=UPI002484FAB6|nr:uncharacterized protein LOC129913073 [Episyrphus balteatus]